jgi:hypothetical protein
MARGGHRIHFEGTPLIKVKADSSQATQATAKIGNVKQSFVEPEEFQAQARCGSGVGKEFADQLLG